MLLWLRERVWLRAAYSLLPLSFRRALSRWSRSAASEQLVFPSLPNWDKSEAIKPHLRALSSAHGGCGINMIGFFRGQFGIAESARNYARALLSMDIPVALNDIGEELEIPSGDDSLDQLIVDSLPYAITIICVNPDHLELALRKIDTKDRRGYIFASWFWELEKIPDEWQTAINQVDEIIVSSSFIEQAFKLRTDKPILKAAPPIRQLQSSGLGRRDFGIDENVFLFVNSFDFNSRIARKNPYATISAFQQAFPEGTEKVQLLIKTSNAIAYLDELQELRKLAAQDRRISIRDELIESAHFVSLLACANVYVSLHRSEGFGLGIAEAMSLGKPVIATAWSGNMEYMTTRNSFLVGYALSEIKSGQYPASEGQLWADPDICLAANFMRQLFVNPELARTVGEKAARDIREQLNPALIAGKIKTRCEQIMLEAIRFEDRQDIEKC
ncbi:glycosyltransferase [Pseudoxanthomonas dokdonensis]|uniref:Uncharacterized protein n=1 Tax=Pseudoxanthomonas dokdonensis TaxID=344882 RepID=A0A0R0CJE0_9GAMM|nr:glycosyltransferase [Pseudoxanthomonas dokdonensis]KRG69611.1 hypothetical protein ABB29_09060 [Pseudoxanthomonas dokdonensis]